MDALNTSTDLDKAISILSGLSLPPEVAAISAAISEDFSGSPALLVTVRLGPGAVKQRSDVKKITDFTGDVPFKLLHGGITVFPYVKLEEAA